MAHVGGPGQAGCRAASPARPAVRWHWTSAAHACSAAGDANNLDAGAAYGVSLQAAAAAWEAIGALSMTRTSAAFLTAFACASLLGLYALAQDAGQFPTRAIHIIVANAAGG